MFWIFAIVAIVVALIAGCLAGDWEQDYLWGAIVGLFWGLITSAILYAIYFIVTSTTTDEQTTYQLKEMQLTSQTEGGYHTFLTIGGGGFGKKDHYYFYVKSPDGSIQLDKIKSSLIVFYEGDYKPHMKCDTHTKEQRYTKGWSTTNCEFYIPTGTINDDIDVHLKGNVG